MTAALAIVQDHWGWLVFATLLGIAEVLLPGVFLIWIAIAAALTGLAALALPIALPFQFLLFAGLSIAAVWGGRRWYADNPVASTDPQLNDRSARLIGQTVIVIDPILGGEGRVKVADGVWTATGPDTPVGARVRVIAVDGTILLVEGV